MATATSSRRHGRRALAVLLGTASLAALAAIALAVTVLAVTVLAVTVLAAPASRTPASGFPALVPAAAPASWPRLTLPNGTAVLSYLPSLHPLHADTDAASAARVTPGGAFRLYLNATPRQGDERLRGWAAFRLRLLRADDAATARQIAAADGVRFRGGSGSCVIDSYVTKIHANHFQEIACLVQGHTGASVIVAAAPSATWAQARPLLLRSVAAYQVR